MLAAVDGQGERVRARAFKSAHEIRIKYGKGELRCPFCKEVVFARERPGFVLHFVHRSPCTSSVAHHPESPEHEQGKMELAKLLNQQIKDEVVGTAEIRVEYHLPNCGEHGRIADVALVYGNGNLLIAECQLSPITPDELEQRTRDYQSIGADVLWFLGKDADTEQNRTWVRSVFGAVGRLEFNYE